MQKTLFWIRMPKTIKAFCRTCYVCQVSKPSMGTERIGKYIPIACEKRFQIVAMDLVGPLPVSSTGMKHILTMQDRFSRYIREVPLENKSSLSVAMSFFNEWICLFGVPEKLLSDNGGEFISEVCRLLNYVLGIKHVLVSEYHPECNGGLERFHRTMKEAILAKSVQTNWSLLGEQIPWEQLLPGILMEYNGTKCRPIGVEPSKVIFGERVVFAEDVKLRAKRVGEVAQQGQGVEEFVENLQGIIEAVRVSAVSHQKKYDSLREKTMNKRRIFSEYKVDDLVLHLVEGKKGNERKFAPHYTGPWKVDKIRGPVNVELIWKGEDEFLTKKWKGVVRVAHVSKLKPYYDRDGDLLMQDLAKKRQE